MKTESFDKDFATLRELGPDVFVLRGSTIIVEIQEQPELKTAGGIVIATTKNHAGGNSVEAHKVEIGKVVAVGQGYWNPDFITEKKDDHGTYIEKGGYEALPLSPGAMVILPQYSTSILSMFPGINRPTSNKLAMVKMDDVLAYYPTKEAFELAQSKLQS